MPTDRGERTRGIEALSQRLLALVVTLVRLVPAAKVALPVGLSLSAVLGSLALPVAGLAAAGVLVGEVWLALLRQGPAG